MTLFKVVKVLQCLATDPKNNKISPSDHLSGKRGGFNPQLNWRNSHLERDPLIAVDASDARQLKPRPK